MAIEPQTNIGVHCRGSENWRRALTQLRSVSVPVRIETVNAGLEIMIKYCIRSVVNGPANSRDFPKNYNLHDGPKWRNGA